MSTSSMIDHIYRYWGKRIFDLAFLFSLLPLLLLILGIAAFAVIISLGFPVIFSQVRPGRCGRPFVLIKFRTMNNAKDVNGFLLPDGQRLTMVGYALRSTSLDELPSLWNLLKGDISLVGPRPLLMEYLDRYSPKQARRHEVKPGLTGWAQVNGRNAITWEEKFKYDVWYVDNYGLALDMRIIWMTLSKVIKREGINQPGYATMERFKGVGGQRERQV